jgi:hypothetical protein
MKFPPLTVRSLQSLARVIFGGAEKSHVAVLCQGIAAQQKMIANALVADAILDCSKRGGIILDVFAGSGTTLIAAEKAGRRGYGIEIDCHYTDIIIRRFDEVYGLRQCTPNPNLI